MNTIFDKDKSINFQSIKMKPVDLVVSCELLRSYTSTNRLEFGEKAFEIFDKYIKEEAKSASKNNNIDFNTVYDYLYKIFWNSLADLKLKYSGAENLVKQICLKLQYGDPVNKSNNIGNDEKANIPSNRVKDGTFRTEEEEDSLTATSRRLKYRERAASISNKNAQGVSYRKIANNEGVSQSATRRASLRHRNNEKLISGELPGEITEKAQELISVLNLKSSLSDVIKLLVANPALIPADVKKIEEKLNILSKALNVDKQKLAEAGTRAIVVYTAQPETTINNIDTTVKNIEKFFDVQVDRGDYINACLVQPSTLAYKPQTIITKMKTVEKYLRDKNINFDRADYVNSWIRSLWLLSSSAERTITKLDKLYSDNDSVDWSMIKNLFEEVVYMDNDKISQNIDSVIQEFKSFGLTREEYETAARKQKPLAKQNPLTIIKKVKALSEIFIQNGLSLKDCLKVCVKQPTLFYQATDTIKEHIRAYMYVYKNKYNQSGKEAIQNLVSRCLTYSALKIYLDNIIYPQLKNTYSELSSLKLTNLQANVAEFFINNPNAKCTIEIVEDEMKEHFIQTMDDFCQKYIGRNVFNYELVPPRETIHVIKKGPKAASERRKPQKSYDAAGPAKKISSAASHEQKLPAQVNNNSVQSSPQPKEKVSVPEIPPKQYISAPIVKSKLKSQDFNNFMKNGRLLIQYENKLTAFVENFNWKGDIADLRAAFIKHPELFLMQLPVLVNNINLLANNIELDDKSILVECMLRNPTPFYNSPQKLEDTIKNLLTEFGRYGLTKEKLLGLYASKASLLSSDKIIENLRAYLYVSKFYKRETSFNVDTILDKSITVPEVNIYLDKIIIPKILSEVYTDEKLTPRNFAEFMVGYLKKHSFKEFNIRVLNDYMGDNFMEVMDEYSQKSFGRGIFNYTK